MICRATYHLQPNQQEVTRPLSIGINLKHNMSRSGPPTADTRGKSMNYRKGLTRMAIVWTGCWGLWFWNGYEMHMRAERGLSEVKETQQDYMIDHHFEMMTRGEEMMSQALNYGLLLPFTLMIVAGLAYWVWRGFKPKMAGSGAL